MQKVKAAIIYTRNTASRLDKISLTIIKKYGLSIVKKS